MPTRRAHEERANDHGAETTRLLIDDETSEAPTTECSQPTRIDATLLDQPSSRLQDLLAATRDQHGWVPVAVLTLLLGINLLILGRISTTRTGDAPDIDKAPGSMATIEASNRAQSDIEPDALATPETRDTPAQKTRDSERPAASVNSEHRSRILSGQTLRIEAAIDSEFDAILPAARPAGPPQVLARDATFQSQAPSPSAEAPRPKPAVVQPQGSESMGGQGWIIERK
jgi:hypothetical protein